MEKDSSDYLWHETNKRLVIIEKFEYENQFYFRFNKIIFRDREKSILHRLNGNPASIEYDDCRQWIVNGKFHRKNDLPAVIRKSVEYEGESTAMRDIVDNLYEIESLRNIRNLRTPIQEYWVNGKLHRENDLPAVVFNDSKKHSYWYEEGKLHRNNNKPAIINGNFLHYFNNGELYKSEIQYDNKIVNWIMNNPFKLVGIIFLLLLSITIFSI